MRIGKDVKLYLSIGLEITIINDYHGGGGYAYGCP